MEIDSITLSLRWSDEDDIRRLRRYENRGDTFTAEITIDGRVADSGTHTNNPGSSGSIDLEYDHNSTDSNISSVAEVGIELVTCGDYHPVLGGGLVTIEDSSNTYQLEITVSYRNQT